jgi:hypothetical protein
MTTTPERDFVVEVYRPDGSRFSSHHCDGRYEIWPSAERAMLNAILDSVVGHVVLRLTSEH